MNIARPFMLVIKFYECVEEFIVVIPCLYCTVLSFDLTLKSRVFVM